MQFNNVYLRFFSACIIISFAITCLIAVLPISPTGNEDETICSLLTTKTSESSD